MTLEIVLQHLLVIHCHAKHDPIVIERRSGFCKTDHDPDIFFGRRTECCFITDGGSFYIKHIAVFINAPQPETLGRRTASRVFEFIGNQSAVITGIENLKTAGLIRKCAVALCVRKNKSAVVPHKCFQFLPGAARETTYDMQAASGVFFGNGSGRPAVHGAVCTAIYVLDGAHGHQEGHGMAGTRSREPFAADDHPAAPAKPRAPARRHIPHKIHLLSVRIQKIQSLSARRSGYGRKQVFPCVRFSVCKRLIFAK